MNTAVFLISQIHSFRDIITDIVYTTLQYFFPFRRELEIHFNNIFDRDGGEYNFRDDFGF